MSDSLLSHFLKPVHDSVKKFTKKNPKLTKYIGWGIVIVSVLSFLYYLDKEFNFINFSGKTEKELTIEWFEENFTDSTFNVLIFPFNDYIENPDRNIRIEKAITERLDSYRREDLKKKITKSKILIKCYSEIERDLSPDSIEILGKNFGADIIIYGDIYDQFDLPQLKTTIRYIILTEPSHQRMFNKEGEIGEIRFNSLAEIREGILIKDLDYITYWIYCNEMIYYKDKEAVLDVWNSIQKIFSEEIFSGGNSYLCQSIGYFLFKNDNMNLAKVFFLRSIKYGQTSIAFNNLGGIYLRAGLKDSALICYNKAIEIDSNYIMGYTNLASMYINESTNIELAKNYLEKSIQINKSDGISFFNLGLIYDRFLINQDSAIFYFKKSFELLPDSLIILRIIGSAYIGVNNDSAKYYLLSALSRNKKDYISYNELGRLHTNLGNQRTAEKFYFESIKLNSNNPIAFNNLGYIYEKRYNTTDTAIAYYNKSIACNKNYFLPYFNLGRVFYEEYKNHKKAKYYFLKSLALNKYYTRTYEYLGHIYFIYEKKIDSSYFYYKEAVARNSQNAGVYSNLGIIHTDHFVDYKSAEKYFLKAISIEPKTAGYYLNYALLLVEHLNDSKRGKEIYLKAIRVDSTIRSDQYDKLFYLNEKF